MTQGVSRLKYGAAAAALLMGIPSLAAAAMVGLAASRAPSGNAPLAPGRPMGLNLRLPLTLALRGVTGKLGVLHLAEPPAPGSLAMGAAAAARGSAAAGPLAATPSAHASPWVVYRLAPPAAAARLRQSPPGELYAGPRATPSRADRSLAGVAQSVAGPAAELSALPRSAPAERSWQMGRRVWEAFSGERGAQPSQPWVLDPAGLPTLPASIIPAGEQAAARRGGAGRGVDSAPSAERAARPSYVDVPEPREAAAGLLSAGRPALEAADDLSSRGRAAGVARLALRVAGETLVLTEESFAPASARALALATLAAAAPARLPSADAPTRAAVEASGSSSWEPLSAARAQVQLWTTLQAQSAPPPRSSASSLPPARGASSSVPLLLVRRSGVRATLPWALLLPLALAALRYRREFLS